MGSTERSSGGFGADGPSRIPATFPRALREFVALVNRGEYWESHEALEDAWRKTGSDFYHGLILYASAFVHARRENAHGVVAQLDKAEERLERFRPAYLGVDVEEVLRHARRCREIVEEGDEDPGGWVERIPFPTLRPDPARMRGDEPELEPGDEPDPEPGDEP